MKRYSFTELCRKWLCVMVFEVALKIFKRFRIACRVYDLSNEAKLDEPFN